MLLHVNAVFYAGFNKKAADRKSAANRATIQLNLIRKAESKLIKSLFPITIINRFLG
jgi:hypothetical protein